MVYLKLFMKIHIFEKTVHRKFASLNQRSSISVFFLDAYESWSQLHRENVYLSGFHTLFLQLFVQSSDNGWYLSGQEIHRATKSKKINIR